MAASACWMNRSPSVKKLLALKDRYPVYYPSHGPVPCRMDEGVETLLECLEKLRDGELQGKPLTCSFPPTLSIHTFEYDYKNINLNYNPELGPWPERPQKVNKKR